MDIKELITWSWQHKWWFVVSLVLCIGIGVLYFFSCTPVYNVRASIMLRTPDVKTQQGELMSLMGADANKTATDEIEILSSRDLVEQIVDSLHLSVLVEERRHLRWIPVFPFPEFALEYEQPVIKKTIKHTKHDGKKYRITIFPRIAAIDMTRQEMQVSRLARESQVIVLSQATANPYQTVTKFNILLDLYNQADTKDRNKIALQSKTFLDRRLVEVQTQLNDIEMTLERYKTQYQITDIEKVATHYRTTIENYQIELSEINLKILELDRLDEQLKDSLVLANSGGIYSTLDTCNIGAMCDEYNKQVLSRISLIQTAKPNNPVVQSLDFVLHKQRENIQRGSNQLRYSLQQRKIFVEQQIQKYTADLAQLPEQERTSLALEREKEAMEEQYLFLIEKKEENSLTLNSSSLPAKMVESPRVSAILASPHITKIAFLAILFGALLPFLVFFFDKYKKEFSLSQPNPQKTAKP